MDTTADHVHDNVRDIFMPTGQASSFEGLGSDLELKSK